MVAASRIPVQFHTLAGGFQGTDETVALMSQMAMGQFGARSPKINALANQILRQANVPEKNYAAEMVAIHNWVRDRIRYTRDVVGQETLYQPEYVAFTLRAGDCDDKSMLDAALLASIGIVTRFKVIGVTPGSYSHVYLEARPGPPGSSWIPLDPIMKNKPAGWEAPASTAVISKTFPENTPSGLDTMPNMNGLGYHIADQRLVSHLSDDPPVQPAPPNYVIMDSMLDNDLPIEALTNNQPAFPMNAHYNRVPGPTLLQRRPQMMDKRLAPAWVQAQAQQDVDAQNAAEFQAMNPGQGMNDVMLPDDLAALADPRIGVNMQPQPEQRPMLAQTPEGIDTMFGRAALVMRGDKGDRIIYRGELALNERPPIRPVQGIAGLGAPVMRVRAPVAVAPRGRSMMPGMGGYLAGHSLSGPGMAELHDTASDAQAAINAISAAIAPPPPPPSRAPLYIGLALLLGGAYLASKRKG